MIWKILVSVALCAGAFFGINALAPSDAGQAYVILYGLAWLITGYHRNLVPKGGTISWTRVYTPTEEQMHRLDTLWGVRLSRPGRVRVGPNSRQFSHQHPSLARAAELLPLVLRGPTRRAAVWIHRRRP